MTEITPLNLPAFEVKLSGSREKAKIFDFLRRRYVVLTPEEWVRQHFVHFLTDYLGYPTALLANETQLTVGDKHLRADTVLYSREMRPRMIIEYKAPHVSISQKTLEQIASYNTLLRADYLVMSNGIDHICCKVDFEKGLLHQLPAIPPYDQL